VEAGITKAKAKRKVLCKHTDGKALVTGMMCLYTDIHCEMKESILQGEDEQNE
jgi:hypothetical protein